ncbi:hypothetical protein IE992_29830 [Klebsiella pneumoniae]|uniref:TraT complement resistance protein n=1 Tax=Klebsiella pneumoniae TaxID=573 RepID=A0A927HVR4_KLEPN|nr:hypothetical protein [Klebsiella pneumoniae]
MSETIWLEPSNNKTVYLQIKNTSDKDMSGLQAKIASAVTSKGYQVVSNPDTAGYWIRWRTCLRPIKWTFVSLRAG